MLRKRFCCQHFRGPPLEEKRFQRQTANATNLPKFLASRIAMQMLRGTHASLKFLLPKFSWATPGRRRIQRQTANATNLPKFLALRLVLKTLRGAYALLEFLFREFSRTTLGRQIPKNTAGATKFRRPPRTQQQTYVHTYLPTHVHTYLPTHVHTLPFLRHLFCQTNDGWLLACLLAGASEGVARSRSCGKGKIQKFKALSMYMALGQDVGSWAKAKRRDLLAPPIGL